MGQSPEDNLSPNTIGIFVFPRYDEAIGRATRPPNRRQAMAPGFWGAAVGVALMAAALAMADEAPKYGGVLSYMIPADSPPSFDAQREETYATIHSAAPFYSVLIRI